MQPITLTGTVEGVTYHNADNGFAVLKVTIRGEKDPLTVVGHAASVNAGEYITMTGLWFQDRDHGRQFKASALQVTPPHTPEGIEKYLGSGLIKGIGPVYAKRLVGVFGVEVFDVIERQTILLKTVPGVGDKRIAMIQKGWQQQKHVRQIMLFLHQNGIATSRAVRIYKTYGEQAITVIQENPYRLAQDIRGIGFVSADKIALGMGLVETSMKRLVAGIEYALLTAMDEGHCALPQAELLALTADLLKVDPALIPEALIQAEAQGLTLLQDDKAYLPVLYHQERWIAQKMLTLLKGPLPSLQKKILVIIEQKKALLLRLNTATK